MRDYANTADKEIIVVLAGCIGYAGLWRCAVGQQGMPVSGIERRKQWQRFMITQGCADPLEEDVLSVL